MRFYRWTPSQVSRSLISGEPVPEAEIPFVHSAVSDRTICLRDPVVVDAPFAERYGVGRRHRSMVSLIVELGGVPTVGNPLEWMVRELRALEAIKRN